MFDVDQFITDCLAAAEESDPRLAVRDVLARAVRESRGVAEALPATRAELTPLHVSDKLTVLKVVWGPGMTIVPHNHLMWAAIGLYGGQEDNTFYRRSNGSIVVSGGRELRTGDVALLGDDTIHSVANPTAAFTGAIHVYGGDLTRQQGRSEWEEGTLAEVPYDFERTKSHFDAVEAER